MTEKGYTAKKEAFAVKFIECNNASEAYKHAYNAENMKNETIHKRACELAKDGYVKGRIKELRDKQMEKHEVTMDNLTEIIRDAITLAKDLQDPSNIRGGAMDLAKLHGMIVDRKNVQANVSYTEFLDELAND